MLFAANRVQEKLRHTVDSKMDIFGSNPFLHHVLWRFRKKLLSLNRWVVATLSSCSRAWRQERKKPFLSLRVKGAVDTRVVWKFTAEKVEIVLYLSENKVSAVSLERKVPEQEVIVKKMTVSLNQLKKHRRWLNYENRFRQETDEQVMREYGEQKTVMGRNTRRLVESVSICVAKIDIRSNRAILKRC